MDGDRCREDQTRQAYFAETGFENFAPEIGTIFRLHSAIFPIFSTASVITRRQSVPSPGQAATTIGTV